MTTRRAAGDPDRTDSLTDVAVTEPADHAIGRSRGGLTTEVHTLTDGRGRALVVLLSAGDVNDTPVFAPLLAAVRVTATGRADRVLLRRRGIADTVPEPRDQQADRRREGSAGGRPVGSTTARYARRNVVERGFCQLSQRRGLATRYDRHARDHAGALDLAALLTWLP